MKIGIALSGGGAKGIAHLGVLKALDESGIAISVVSGTSAGAICGAFYCSGYRPEEILEIITTTKLFKHFKLTFTWNGLLDINKVGLILSNHISENSFEALQIPLIVAATELQSGKPKYFKKGKLIKPVLASCCVPVIFHPVEYKKGIFVDGGILMNLPSQVLKKKCDYIIGSSCNPIGGGFQLSGVKKLVERSMLLAINGNNSISKKKCDLIIEPEILSGYSAFELKKANEIFKAGYDETKKLIPEIEKVMSARLKNNIK